MNIWHQYGHRWQIILLYPDGHAIQTTFFIVISYFCHQGALYQNKINFLKCWVEGKAEWGQSRHESQVQSQIYWKNKHPAVYWEES